MNVSSRRRAPPVPTSLLCCAGCGGPSARRTPTEPDQLLGATSAGGRTGTGHWEPLCVQRGSPPQCPVLRAPCASRAPSSLLFVFSSTSRQIAHAARSAGIPLGCPPPLHTHMHMHTRSHDLLSLQSLPTFPDALASQLAAPCSCVLSAPLHPPPPSSHPGTL